MEVKPGYKQTEVGVIPEEWEVKPLRRTCAAFIDNGVARLANERSVSGDGVPFINVSDDRMRLSRPKCTVRSAED